MSVPVPPGFVTVTFTRPAACAPVVPVIVVSLTTVKLVRATPPTVAPVAPVKLVPVRVTLVPPAMGPPVGEIPDTVGVAK